MDSLISAHFAQRSQKRIGFQLNEDEASAYWTLGRLLTDAEFWAFGCWVGPLYRMAIIRGMHVVLVRGLNGTFITCWRVWQ
jgi:hypothetical protein